MNSSRRHNSEDGSEPKWAYHCKNLKSHNFNVSGLVASLCRAEATHGLLDYCCIQHETTPLTSSLPSVFLLDPISYVHMFISERRFLHKCLMIQFLTIVPTMYAGQNTENNIFQFNNLKKLVLCIYFSEVNSTIRLELNCDYETW